MKGKNFLYSQKVAPYVFVMPFIASFIVFWIYPLRVEFYSGLTD